MSNATHPHDPLDEAQAPRFGGSAVGLVSPSAWLAAAFCLGMAMGRVVIMPYWAPLIAAAVFVIIGVIGDHYARERNRARQSARRRESRRRWEVQTGQIPVVDPAGTQPRPAASLAPRPAPVETPTKPRPQELAEASGAVRRETQDAAAPAEAKTESASPPAEIDYTKPWGAATGVVPAVPASNESAPSDEHGHADKRSPLVEAEDEPVAREAKTAAAGKATREITIPGESVTIGQHLMMGGYGFVIKFGAGFAAAAGVDQSTTYAERTALRPVSEMRLPVMRNFAVPADSFAELPFETAPVETAPVDTSPTEPVPDNRSGSGTPTAAAPTPQSADEPAELAVPEAPAAQLSQAVPSRPFPSRRERRLASATGQLDVTELRNSLAALEHTIDTQANTIVPPSPEILAAEAALQARAAGEGTDITDASPSPQEIDLTDSSSRSQRDA